MNARLEGAKQTFNIGFGKPLRMTARMPARAGDAGPSTMPGAKTKTVPTLNRREASFSAIGRGHQQEQNDSLSPKGADRADKTVNSAQVESAVVLDNGPKVQTNLLQSDSSGGNRVDDPRGNPDETRETRTVGCAAAPTQDARYSVSTCARQATKERIAAGQEATSTQVVKRGHQVTMIKVPDEDNDVSFQRWLIAGSPMTLLKPHIAMLPTPPDSLKKTHSLLPNEGVGSNDVTKTKVTLSMVAKSPATGAKTQEVPHRWMRPFEVDWTLCAVCKAQNNNAAQAALAVWVHKDKNTKITDELLTQLRSGGESAREQLYELRKPPRVIHCLHSSKSDFLVDMILNPVTGTRTLSMKGLLDSRCTSSAINRSFVEKHTLETHKVAVPIPVYNADGT